MSELLVITFDNIDAAETVWESLQKVEDLCFETLPGETLSDLTVTGS